MVVFAGLLLKIISFIFVLFFAIMSYVFAIPGSNSIPKKNLRNLKAIRITTIIAFLCFIGILFLF